MSVHLSNKPIHARTTLVGVGEIHLDEWPALAGDWTLS